MKVLDLFCGAGGASMGYHRAGFEVVGVDINQQPSYPFPFFRTDALEVLSNWEEDSETLNFDLIHASPPCQLYTKKPSNWGRKRAYFYNHEDLLGKTREKLEEIGLPYVLENVIGAPIRKDLLLCGTMFDLKISKHRLFEANWKLPEAPEHKKHINLYNPWSGKGRTAKKFREAQDTPWIPMAGGNSRKRGYTGDLYNTIPPAYTEYIGRAFLENDRKSPENILHI